MQVVEHGSVLVVSFQAENYSELWSLLEPYVGSGKRSFVLDCSNVRFLNSLSIASIITARNKVNQAGGKMVLAEMANHVKSVFRILKLERLFALDLSIEQAINAAK